MDKSKHNKPSFIIKFFFLYIFHYLSAITTYLMDRPFHILSIVFLSQIKFVKHQVYCQGVGKYALFQRMSKLTASTSAVTLMSFINNMSIISIRLSLRLLDYYRKIFE